LSASEGGFQATPIRVEVEVAEVVAAHRRRLAAFSVGVSVATDFGRHSRGDPSRLKVRRGRQSRSAK
jgi:hypothetical protein